MHDKLGFSPRIWLLNYQQIAAMVKRYEATDMRGDTYVSASAVCMLNTYLLAQLALIPLLEENLTARPMCPGGHISQGNSILPDRIYCPPLCPGLGGKSVHQENVSRPDPILALHSYKSSYKPACQKLIERGKGLLRRVEPS